MLLVGGPTHAFGMSRPATRNSAREQADGSVVSTGRGVREWIAALAAKPEVAVHTFDTRVRVRGLPGSAARGLRRALRRAGFAAGNAESFWVTGTPGPLVAGETTRAKAWGEDLAVHAPRTAP